MKRNLQSAYNTRQYMLSRDFELYYYSDNKVPQVATHSHDYYEFYFFIDGNAGIEIDGRVTELMPGDIVVMTPGVKHRAVLLDGDKKYSRFVFWVSREYFDYMFAQSVSFGYLIQHVVTTGQRVFHNDKIAFNNIEGKIFSLMEEINADRFGKNERIRLCVMDLMLHLNRIVYEANHPATDRENQTLYQNVLTFVEQHLDEDVSLERLEQEFFVSKYHVEHVFKEQMGLSLHQYIIKKRLSAVRDAIVNGADIATASLNIGFNDYSGFFRAFKKEYGISPSEYKKVYGNTVSD
ncbi:MAG: helix-turn-helix transcriptional regulator [Pseudobutyrivibrio sp.]|nr:helix-turn-helix transcriptional regulator [Pseudobutyrivibrio sp.]